MYQYSKIKNLLYSSFVCRLRIEEVEELIIDSVTLRPNDEVDFWFTNIRQNFSMTGTCKKQGCYLLLAKLPKNGKNINICKRALFC